MTVARTEFLVNDLLDFVTERRITMTPLVTDGPTLQFDAGLDRVRVN